MSKCEQGNSYVCGLATSIDLLPSKAVLRDMHSPERLWLQAECLCMHLFCFTGPHIHRELDKDDLSHTCGPDCQK